jgi:hypothetical protein
MHVNTMCIICFYFILISSLSCSAWLAAVSLCVLILVICLPLIQLFFAYFKYDILYHHICQFHFLKTVACNFAFYSLVHISSHIFMWKQQPSFSVNGVHLYSFLYPSFFFGAAMVNFFSFYAVLGLLGKSFRWSIFAFVVGLICFYFHGIQKILSPPYGRSFLTGIIYKFVNFSARKILFLSCTIDFTTAIHSENPSIF